MYCCTDCGKKFERPIYKEERHSLDTPPYEPVSVCPYCASGEIEQIVVRHCRCCGARLYGGRKDYCDDTCRRRGERLWKLQSKRKEMRKTDPIYCVVSAAEHYNKEHGTSYSYGQYVGLVLNRKEKRK